MSVSEQPLSVALSATAVSSRVAVCAPAPEKPKTGVLVVSLTKVIQVLRVAPVLEERLQSVVVILVQGMIRGTSMAFRDLDTVAYLELDKV
ncbi:MAG: hypothetical protein OXH57_09830 [Ekhidna sp.]|nr:hypothetical protein [Ekhidna sp.]